MQARFGRKLNINLLDLGTGIVTHLESHHVLAILRHAHHLIIRHAHLVEVQCSYSTGQTLVMVVNDGVLPVTPRGKSINYVLSILHRLFISF